MHPKKSEHPPSQEFLEKEKIAKLDLANFKIKHKLKIEEFQFQRESDRLHHERELERGRIKSAEIRKSQMRREHGAFKY